LEFIKCRLLGLKKSINANQTETPEAHSDMMGLFYTKKENAILLINATDSVEGTSDKPKFALRSIFQKKVFPRIAELAKPLEENTLSTCP
jgi:hypothetical protein